MGTLSVLMVTIAFVIPLSTAVCSRFRFGDRCQYLCRCSFRDCASDGSCQNGRRCSVGFFGPACQYLNLAHNRAGKVSLNGRLAPALSDENSTWVKVNSRENITLEVREPFIFTWLRLVTMETYEYVTHPFLVTFTSDKGEVLYCKNEGQYIYKNAVHIYCNIDVKVKKLVVLSKFLIYLNSLHVSGGRDVAVMQKTKFSSPSMKELWSSSRAVDGSSSYLSCAATKVGIGKHSWSVIFSRPYMVHTIRVFPWGLRDRTEPFSLNNVTVETFNAEEKNVGFFNIQTGQSKPRYVTIGFSPQSISRIDVFKHLTSPVVLFALCEVEAWGDCPIGYYGLDCAVECPSACPTSCSVFDGLCDDKIEDSCPRDFYGCDCKSQCNETCENQRCSKLTGKCEVHPPGACSRLCPMECQDDCDPGTGQCLRLTSTDAPAIVFLTVAILGTLTVASTAGFTLMRSGARKSVTN